MTAVGFVLSLFYMQPSHTSTTDKENLRENRENHITEIGREGEWFGGYIE